MVMRLSASETSFTRSSRISPWRAPAKTPIATACTIQLIGCASHASTSFCDGAAGSFFDFFGSGSSWI